MSSGVKSIKLDKINSVGVFGMTVRLDTIGDEDVVIGSYSPEIRTKLSSEIQKIVNDYQSKKEAQSATTFVQQTSAADELKKFKELLDMGVITQEEFDAKKKQLLGL